MIVAACAGIFRHGEQAANSSCALQAAAQIQTSCQRQRWHIIRVAQLDDVIAIPDKSDFVGLHPRAANPAILAFDPQTI